MLLFSRGIEQAAFAGQFYDICDLAVCLRILYRLEPAAEWPFAAESLAAAVRRGYEQLPRSQKRLPLV